ncbi:MAG: NAD(P)(+) transhydrogenase (Re/Si-specific) subunit beta [Hyphomicrobiales bacterium]|nr:NAD(P)(+) transhydrogenase (Re/Si-specific) subunit beta [Hyphomicrobiales bacterium]
MSFASAMAYLVASVLFILALKGLSSPKSARRGNLLGILGMVLAIYTTISQPAISGVGLVITGLIVGGVVGTVIALRIQMTAMPQLVAAFHSLVGLAACLIATAALYSPEAYGIGIPGHIKLSSLIELSLGLAIGAVTFTGSVIAFLKLQGLMKSAPLRFAGQHLANALIGVAIVVLILTFCGSESHFAFWLIMLLSLLLGVLLIVPIGGADMPVVISMLNSYSGWAAAGIGFTLGNMLLIITGALVGASGAILSYIMCKAMNRSIFNVILGGFGTGDDAQAATAGDDDRQIQQGNAEDAAFLMGNSKSIIIVPGYGMAVAQAQHALREMGDLLKAKGLNVRYAIHPVAGRMPGHMNVLLAEANVPYDEVFELDEINNDFAETDIAFVIGANDITNPAAKTDPKSPIYGMPVLDVERAGQVLFIKRSMASGYAGVENSLFFNDNTMMLFGDAKQMTENIVRALKAL